MSELIRDDLIDDVIADGNVISFACACGARLGVFHLDASRRELRVTLRQHVCVAEWMRCDAETVMGVLEQDGGWVSMAWPPDDKRAHGVVFTELQWAWLMTMSNGASQELRRLVNKAMASDRRMGREFAVERALRSSGVVIDKHRAGRMLRGAR
jgi:hypothetical protein